MRRSGKLSGVSGGHLFPAGRMRALIFAPVLVFLLMFPGGACAKKGSPRWETKFEGIEEPYFSVVWLTDTQTMTEHPRLYPALKSMFRWIIESKDTCNTICVIHTGDIVEYGGNEDYWAMITPLIEEVSAFLPFISVAGNHDIDRGDNDWSYYLSQPFLKETDSTTLYRDGKGICTLMNSNGTEVLFVGLGYDMTDQDAIRWAKDVFEEHPLATGVFLTHSYLGYATSKTSMYTKNGVLFRDRLVAACPQISFVLSGHKKGACHIVERYDDDGNGTAERIVHVMRYNYQGNKTLKRAGFLRVLTVFPSSGRLRVYTYAPYSDLEVCDPRFSKQEYFFIEGLV